MAQAQGAGPDISRKAFHVLLALERGPLHGYAIMREVAATTATRVGPGAIYGAIQRLEQAGLVREGKVREPERGSHRRQEYEITRMGRRTLRNEARRYVELAQLVRHRNLIGGEGRS